MQTRPQNLATTEDQRIENIYYMHNAHFITQAWRITARIYMQITE